MKGRSTGSFYKYGCCVNCEIEFIEGREQRWLGGWRPTAEQVNAYQARLSESS